MQNELKESKIIGRVIKSNGKGQYTQGLISSRNFDEEIYFDRACIRENKEYNRFHDDDIVEFVPKRIDGRYGLWAVDITPVITMRMIKAALKSENLYVRKYYNKLRRWDCYLVVDENNFIQSPEYGMSFDELAQYAGFKKECKHVRETEEKQDPRLDIVEALVNDFDFKVPILSWSGMEQRDLKAIYYDLLMQKREMEATPD